MERFRKEKTWLAIGYIACIVVIWVHLDDFGASEFRGGRLTGPLFYMAVLGSLLFFGRSGFDILSSTNCSHCRTRRCSTLFALLPLHLDARAIPMDFQRRILRPPPRTISLGPLGGCWDSQSPGGYNFEPSQLFQRPFGRIVAKSETGLQPNCVAQGAGLF
jgi:hypothetical protein